MEFKKELDKKTIQLAELGIAFTPSTPVTSIDFFVRRLGEIEEITQSIAESGAHPVLYGERGVGKTSLANFIRTALSQSHELLTVKISCNQSDNTSEIWNKIFTEITNIVDDYDPQMTLPDPDEIVSPINYIIQALEKLHKPILIIIDEFDNIKDNVTQIQLADTIKALSDYIPYITILIVGVADNINDLIGSHASLQRCLKQIKLGRMSPEELQQIIEKGLSRIELTIEEEVKDDIIKFSQGFPHYVHSLAKLSAREAIKKSLEKITRECFDVALNEAIKKADASLSTFYQKAITTNRNQDGFRNVLWACTLVKEDENGTFRAIDIEEFLPKIANRKIKQQSYSYNLGMLCREQKGAVLEKVGESSNQTRYRFKNPLLKAYIKLIIYQQETANFS
jgi:Cdc6-like AAA superfamily ATPase